MIKIWGSADMPKLDVSEMDTEEYKCIAAYMKPDGGVIGAFMSETANPPHFRVVDGSKEMFYTRRKDALAYIDSVGATKMKERRNG
jgi:hypothetical protein